MKKETIILKNLLSNEQYTRKVLPYLNDDLFQEKVEKLLFEEIHSYITKYNQNPTREALNVILSNKDSITEDVYNESITYIDELYKLPSEQNIDWLIDTTEEFCQERSLHNAILQSIHILDGNEKNVGKGMIPKILSDALAISFDPNIGHDYLADADERFNYYHKTEKRIPFDLSMLNKVTKGGLPPKTLNVILGGVNTGKSMFMCHHAATCLSQNYNVLYITLEMAQERIAERIDANLFNIDLDEIEGMTKELFDRKISRLRENIKGKLIIKEFPTASAGSTHFKSLINELWLKKKFRPDIVFIDYVNICCSSRIKPGSNINSYSYIKAISEELRGLAVELNVPIMTATQLTREGFGNSDPDMTDTAESFGLPATADFMLVMITTEDLDAVDQMMFKQIKSRYGDVTKNKRFTIGVDRSKQRFYDVDEKSQKEIQDAGHNFSDNKPMKPEIKSGVTRTKMSEKMQNEEFNEVSETIQKMVKDSRNSPLSDKVSHLKV
jgi:replicative DNA helicase